jgi:gamma-glutamyl-gamma-aminobutyrate hydrolase PuuD
MKRKIFVVGHAISYARWIADQELVHNIEDANIVLFTGGEDINPAIYGCKPHKTTYYNLERDKREIEAYNKVQPHQLCLGICRGLQLLNALNGGLIIQNVDNHSTYGTHPIINAVNPDIRYELTTIHHQMVYPWVLPKDHYKILYYASRRGTIYEGDKIKNPPCEPEIVVYNVPNKPICLGIQGHPEMMRPDAPILTMLNQLIDQYVK